MTSSELVKTSLVSLSVLALLSFFTLQLQQQRADFAKCNNGKANDCYDVGMKLLRAHNEAAAKSYLVEACNRGDGADCYKAGVLLTSRQISVEAKTCFQKALEKGELESYSELGAIELSNGNMEQSERFYREGCSKGIQRACRGLQPFEQEHLCKTGDAAVCSQLATYYEGDHNLLRAMTLWNLSCKFGDMTGCAKRRSFTERLQQAAAETKQKIRKQASIEAKSKCDKAFAVASWMMSDHEAKSCLEAANFAQEDGNLAEERRLLQRGCTGGNRQSCLLLAPIEESLGNVTEAKAIYSKVRQTLRSSCDKGDNEACLNLRVLKDTGITD